MIKNQLLVDDMCHECPYFEPTYSYTKSYADFEKYGESVVTITCKKRELCNHIKQFLGGKNNG